MHRQQRALVRGLALLLVSAGLQAAAQTLPSPPVSPAPVTNYEYDAQGNPTKTIQAPGVSGYNFATSSSYDALSRRKNTTDAKSGVTQFGYGLPSGTFGPGPEPWYRSLPGATPYPASHPN